MCIRDRFKVARVDGAMQTVKISDGRITYQMNVSQGSGYAEITQPFPTYTVPDDETNESVSYPHLDVYKRQGMVI